MIRKLAFAAARSPRSAPLPSLPRPPPAAWGKGGGFHHHHHGVHGGFRGFR